MGRWSWSESLAWPARCSRISEWLWQFRKDGNNWYKQCILDWTLAWTVICRLGSWWSPWQNSHNCWKHCPDGKELDQGRSDQGRNIVWDCSFEWACRSNRKHLQSCQDRVLSKSLCSFKTDWSWWKNQSNLMLMDSPITDLDKCTGRLSLTMPSEDMMILLDTCLKMMDTEMWFWICTIINVLEATGLTCP